MKRVGLNLLAMLVVAAFASLGFWQLDRGRQKDAQLAAAAAARAVAPVPLAQAIDDDLAGVLDGTPPRLRRVQGDAVFADVPPLWLDNQRRGDRVGVRLYCPARAVDGGFAFLVDLGWLPLAGDRRLPDAVCPQGEHALAGLLVPPPSAGLAIGPGAVEQPDRSLLATRIDLAQLADIDGRPSSLARVVLRLDPAIPLGHERDLELHANTLPPERHRGYALQWFGLAATTIVVALVLNLRKRP